MTTALFVVACVATVANIVAALRLRARLRMWRAERRELTEELRRNEERVALLTTRDEQTGALNRRHMVEMMRGELIRHQRLGSPLCIALVQVDRFSSIDERCGRGTGAEVLRRLAAAADKVLRTGDLFARWEGEQFLVLLPHTPLEGGQIALRRLQDHLRTVVVADIAGPFPITLSMSLANVHMHDGFEGAFARATEALQTARSAGGDRIEVAEVLAT
jgi:diguanylate cyclase